MDFTDPRDIDGARKTDPKYISLDLDLYAVLLESFSRVAVDSQK